MWWNVVLRDGEGVVERSWGHGGHGSGRRTGERRVGIAGELHGYDSRTVPSSSML